MTTFDTNWLYNYICIESPATWPNLAQQALEWTGECFRRKNKRLNFLRGTVLPPIPITGGQADIGIGIENLLDWDYTASKSRPVWAVSKWLYHVTKSGYTLRAFKNGRLKKCPVQPNEKSSNSNSIATEIKQARIHEHKKLTAFPTWQNPRIIAEYMASVLSAQHNSLALCKSQMSKWSGVF